MTTNITVTFASREQVDAALGGLRRAGAVCGHSGLPWPESGIDVGKATLHLRVRGTDAALVRDILRRAGGIEKGPPTGFIL